MGKETRERSRSRDRRGVSRRERSDEDTKHSRRKESKEAKRSKEAKETKGTKTKEGKEAKDTKEAKDLKEAKDAKEVKSSKSAKDSKGKKESQKESRKEAKTQSHKEVANDVKKGKKESKDLKGESDGKSPRKPRKEGGSSHDATVHVNGDAARRAPTGDDDEALRHAAAREAAKDGDRKEEKRKEEKREEKREEEKHKERREDGGRKEEKRKKEQRKEAKEGKHREEKRKEAKEETRATETKGPPSVEEGPARAIVLEALLEPARTIVAPVALSSPASPAAPAAPLVYAAPPPPAAPSSAAAPAPAANSPVLILDDPWEDPLPATHVRSLDSASGLGSGSSVGSSSGSFSSESGSDAEGKRKRRASRRRRDLRARTGVLGFSHTPPPQPHSASASGILGVASFPRDARGAQAPVYGPQPATALALLPDKVRGIVDNQRDLAEELVKLKQSAEAQGGRPAKDAAKEESKETVLRMPPRLHEALLHPDNEPRLLARTGLAAACLNQDGLVVLRGHSRKGLMKALGQLRRVAYHCQWGCSQAKVAALLCERPSRPVHTMVVRLAATSSKLQSFEARLTTKVRKLRIGTQASTCQLVVEGIPGLSRRHCTITLEPAKGSCYVQDLSTNGTYLNNKRLPRPPYKNLHDARVRLFHGDELFFRLRSQEAEELGYVVNLLELS